MGKPKNMPQQKEQEKIPKKNPTETEISNKMKRNGHKDAQQT